MSSVDELIAIHNRIMSGMAKDIDEQQEQKEDKPVSKKPTAKKLEIERAGTRIVLPEKMNYEDAIECLKKKKDEDETEISIHEEIETHPLDGAYAMMECLKTKYGWPTAQPTPGFFGPRPPTLVDIDIGYNEKAQIIWGQFKVPTIEGVLKTGSTRNNKGRFIFVLGGTVKQKHKQEIKDLAREIREYVRTNSVYKNQAIRLTTNDEGNLNIDVPPQFFLDVTRINEDELTFSTQVATQINVSLFTPIEKTELCRAAKIPLKRGILLEGPYGTGKTLTAYVTAKKCIENGWTFIYLDRVTGIKDALLFARQYAPAVLFAEDIDRALDGDRDVSVDDILNTIDGVDSKGQEIITILTTNHVEKIEKAMLRPGRLDAVISVQPPDAKAAEKLMRIYGGEMIAGKESLKQAATELAGQIPAVIREVVERAKLYAVSRLSADETIALTGDDLLGSAISMKQHLQLMLPGEAHKPATQRYGETLVALVHEGLNGMREQLNTIEGAVT